MRVTEPAVIFVLAVGTYLVAAALLVFRYDSIFPDAMSRLANAYFVLFSRDPHLAAIGFVWNPLPSMTIVPLLPLRVLWPALVDRAFAANIMSAVFMAGSVVMMRTLLHDLGVPRVPRIALTALFALNPMILYYGANGMSEALFLFVLLTTTRVLTRWIHTGQLSSLVWTGVGLGFAYLTRYEACGAAAAVVVLVAVVTFARTPGDHRCRRLTALGDAAIVALPFAACVAGWALTSWLIVGHPFEQFSSVYGNASQLKLAGPPLPSPSVVDKLLALEPLIPVAVVSVAWVAFRRRDSRPLAAVAVVGGVLSFGLIAAATGAISPHVRYLISAIPLTTALAGGVAVVTPRAHPAPRLTAAAFCTLAVVVTAVSIPATAQTLFDRSLAPVESEQLQALSATRSLTGPTDVRYPYVVGGQVARYLDNLNLAAGSVLVDLQYSGGAFGTAVVLNSRHPRQFVIPTDRDFEPALADPGRFHVRYLLAEVPAGLGRLDALNRAYPHLYESGEDGLATLVREFGTGDPPTWRLYRVN